MVDGGEGVTASRYLETGAGLEAGDESSSQLRLVDEVSPQHNSRSKWEHCYVSRLRIIDAVVVAGAVAAAQVVRFGTEAQSVATNTISGFSYTMMSVALAGLWIAMLVIHRTRSTRVIGAGAEEYRRIGVATFQLFGLIAMISLLFRIDIARGYLAIAFPLGLVGLMLGRWSMRKVVTYKRRQGDCHTSVLVVGNRESVLTMTRNFERDSASGYRVVGVCVPGYGHREEEHVVVDGRAIPVLGNEYSVVDALRSCGADTVVVTATEQLGHDGIRGLVWDLEPLNVDLVVAPGVVDVAGPRLVMRPVAGFPLIHVEKPRYHGAKRFGKTAFDMCFALAALIALSPVMLIAAIAVKTTSKGPVLYKSERMGINGRPFPMLKFRTMVDGADKQVSALLGQNEGAGVLFKMKDDPRITPVGKFLRKYSLDELPQFVNVLRREMSVVGPRPPLRREVEAYDGTVRRRMLVKPGLTGLWQVSGRSDLSWDETVRLDLSYVENWSMMQDVLIVGKTVRAVTAGSGAY
ncbi:exopolysaccharide biosynthesis polyprenyl glycosylphosphotransferase [Rhodococcus hoagii]|nr:exopolysaccharide biosynthesis polyprenyl glycosylphosphotransferase [Prescottella equi]MBM4531952.1 exopolysaccharide biosynthesis polyprenyl glycosylphosphotransferase [Prescottella equi]MBM4543155.1 exopolysaccharide biosynthesis polyprenyl glycosylphosphotransferase [Prescottella equi]MBM4569502.1 exopolysaccharide biosynthesis polyprenyl glycosylphosphotransferase [Prescottella equi]MBM4601563.1 exopolysaccharide biosynthesis polyprenyl glycosylphosphotransferase [Prescottella equi]